MKLVLLVRMIYLFDEVYSKMNQMKQARHRQIQLSELNLVLNIKIRFTKEKIDLALP